MNITLDHQLRNVETFLDDLKKKALINATRMSLNKTLSSVAARANVMIREQRKLKLSAVKSYFRMRKAQGNSLTALEAKFEISSKPVSLINYVVGKRSPQSTAGIKVSKRKSVKVEIVPGVKTTLLSAFIANGRGGNTQVFRRRGKASLPIVKQSGGSLSSIASKDSFRNALQSFAKDRLGIEFKTAFDFQLARAMKNASRGKS